MPSRSDVLLDQLEELQQDLRDLWTSVTKDPVKQARKERAWTALAGVFTAVGAIAARRVAVKAWGILTGEAAPSAKKGPPGAGGGPSTRPEERAPERDETPTRT